MRADSELSDLLQNWSPKAESGTGFNRSVWSRIEAAESRKSSLESLFSWTQGLASPRIAAACMAVALFGGILIGGLQANSALEEQYLLSLKPFSARALVR
jgi:hypothetical protein